MTRVQRRFLRRCRRHLPRWLRKKVKALPINYAFRAYPDHENNCIYHHEQRTIYIPRSYYQDWKQLPTWLKRNNEAAVIHEWGHAIDFNTLSESTRDDLLFVFTGWPTNHHYDFFGLNVPAHVTTTERKATWVYGDWADNQAETYAEGFVAAYTDLPQRKTLTEADKQAVRSSVEGSEA